MKIFPERCGRFALLFLALCLGKSLAQVNGNFIGSSLNSWPNPDEQRKSEAAAELRRQAAIANFVPRDPWRVINGRTNFAKCGWQHFDGRILEVQPGGIRVDGSYGEVCASKYGDREFFVANFPYQVAEDERLPSSQNFTAIEAGVYNYTTTTGSSRTIRKLDYGAVCDPPEPTAEEIAAKEKTEQARRAAAERARADLEARTVAWLKQQSTNNSPSAQFSLGMRYWTGAGVETNAAAALYWLRKSAAQGNAEAQSALSKMSAEK